MSSLGFEQMIPRDKILNEDTYDDFDTLEDHFETLSRLNFFLSKEEKKESEISINPHSKLMGKSTNTII